MLATLSMAGVPWHFDEKVRAYRIREGFRFPLAESAIYEKQDSPEKDSDRNEVKLVAEQLLEQGEAFADSLQQFLAVIRGMVDDPEAADE